MAAIFFVDRSLGKKVGHKLREAGANVELHDDHFAQTTPDSIWIRDVSEKGWVILTKDKNIRRARGEREDVLLAAARVFTLTSGSMSGDEMASIFIASLSAMELVASSQSPPFVYVVGQGLFRQVLSVPTPPDSETDSQS